MTINEIKTRLTVEEITEGQHVLLFDGERIGHALKAGEVEAYKHYAASVIEDLIDREQLKGECDASV